MIIIAIDPGPVESGFVILEADTFPAQIYFSGKMDEIEIEKQIKGVWSNCKFKGLDDELWAAIEMPACYGMAVGKSVFDTCAVVGHFEEFFQSLGIPSVRVYRKQKSPEGIESVVMSLCKNSRAKDSNVRQALIDLYPATGGGKIPQIGTKKNPGPLYGVSKDIWAALAVGITYQKFLMGEQ